MEKGLVVIPEEDTVFPLFSVEENIELSVVKKHSDFIGRIKKNDLKFDMEQLLDAFLKKDEQLYFKQLLVPDDKLTHRRIVICRALMTHPKLILMMHPTDTMDDIKIDEMSKSIRKISEFGCSVIVVSMDVEFLIKTCNRIMVLN
jgi:monosaccharide-transporting ATPase